MTNNEIFKKIKSILIEDCDLGNISKKITPKKKLDSLFRLSYAVEQNVKYKKAIIPFAFHSRSGILETFLMYWNLFHAIEKHYGLEISTDEISNIKTIAELILFIKRKQLYEKAVK